jgi:predicted MFS family arabinose efflux permease
VLIERRVQHPLLPFRILLNRTRATAFTAMMIVPAAMFAMFFFLSLFVQNVMGYSPIHTGLAFLPFCFGMVFAATASSKLMSLVDPRFIAGFGTILAGFSLFMFSRLTVDDSPANLLNAVAHGTSYLGGNVNYWTDLFPYILTMSMGMGLTFVPMTLAAVHGVGQRDSGIGSGVLNTMQQVGGALGLATLATVAVHFTQDKADSIVSSFKAVGGAAPSGQAAEAVQKLVGQAAFANGATYAFIVGAFMMWAASVIVWIFLNVNHEQLATDDGDPVEALVGA